MKTIFNDRGVKASGGIRNFHDAEAMVQAGTTRIGTSSALELVKGDVSDLNN